MFSVETKKPLLVSGSPSYMPNNLSSAPGGAMTFVRINETFLVKPNGETTRLPIARCKVYQSKCIQLQRRNVIAIMSDVGVQIWSADGDNMLFYYAISSLLGTQFEGERYMRGATGQGQYLSVGCSTGTITVFDCSGDLSRGNYPLLHSLESRGNAIYDLSSSPNFLTAGDDMGNIFVYRADSAFELAFMIPGQGLPCTSIVSTEHVVVAGFATGHLRVYRLDSNEMAIEITAHVRMVSGLAYQEDSQMLISCSPDQYIHVWTVPNFRSKANSSMDCLFSAVLENKVCTGVAFLNEQKFAVACYDEDEITVFNRA